MADERRTWEQTVVKLLCDIRAILKKQLEQPSCTPCSGASADYKPTSVSVGTTATRIMGSNPRRLSFTIGNFAAVGTVIIASSASQLGTNAGLVSVAQSSYAQFTAFHFPSSIGGEFWAKSAAGAVTVTIQEELQK